MARRLPRLPSPIRAGVAGSWGNAPGSGIMRPQTAPLSSYTSVQRLAIRPGEGTSTVTVPGSGTVHISLGPEALNTWYVTHCVISTTTGAADTSTCAVQLGPVAQGIVPGGQSYAGGGDSVSLGGRVLRPGEYVTAIWSGANPGDLATLTIYGEQDILM